MSVHTFHPDTHEHGLVDGCPRCAEHAEHPFESLDSRNLQALIARVEDEADARSDNEARAMRVIEATMRRAKLIGMVRL